MWDGHGTALTLRSSSGGANTPTIHHNEHAMLSGCLAIANPISVLLGLSTASMSYP